jgi:hypothetical protein
MTPFDPARPCVLIHARGRMIPQETLFWEALRSSLRSRGCELLLIAHHPPQQPMDAPLLCVRNGLDAVRRLSPSQGWRPWLPTDGSLDETLLLERDREWNGSERDSDHREQRRQALYFYRDFYHHALNSAQPQLTLIWNGEHPQEMILRDLARKRGCPVWYIERAPIPGVIHIDREGILGGSTAARKTKWDWPDSAVQSRWLETTDRLFSRLRHHGGTWWEQPNSSGAAALRARLHVPPGKKIVLFPGQVDADVQNLLYSPHFDGTLDAFLWFVAQTRERDDVFVLGKHHPKSPDSPAAFRAGLGGLGVWLDDVSVQDCLAVADRVAAVNSTVLFEALVYDRPILTLGTSLLSGKGIAHEICDRGRNDAVIKSWMEAEDQAGRQGRWRDFAAHFLSTDGFAMETELADVVGLRGADALAATISGHLNLSAATSRPRHPMVPAPLEEVHLWDHLAAPANARPVPADAPRLLCLTDKSFWAEAYGSQRRIAQLLRFLAQTWEVSVYYIHDIDDQIGGRAIERFPWLRLYCPRAGFSAGHLRPGPFTLEQVLTIEKPAVLLAEFFRITPYLKQCQPATLQQLLCVVDTHDVMHQRTAAFARFGLPPEQPTTETQEAYWLDHYDWILAIQPNEASALRKLTSKPVHTVRHGQEVEPKPRVHTREPFRIGIFSSSGEPQLHGIRWFLTQVWRPLQSEHPSAELHLFGQVCDRLGTEPLPLNVVLRGFVCDLPRAYGTIDVVINSAQFGSGLSIKSSEALCFGKALVSSPIGATGLPVDSNRAFAVCETPAEWLVTLTDLLRVPASRQLLEQEAARYARDHLSPEATYGSFAQELRATVAQGKPPEHSIDLAIRSRALLACAPAQDWPPLRSPQNGTASEFVFILGTGPLAAMVRACLPAHVAVVAHLDPHSPRRDLQFLGRPILAPAFWPRSDSGARIIDGREPDNRVAPGDLIPEQPEAWLQHLVIFGTGGAAQQSIRLLGGPDKVLAFADNDPAKQGTTWQGKPVVAPAELSRFPDARIVIASMHHVAITSQLIDLGIARDRIGVFDITALAPKETGYDPFAHARELASYFFDFTDDTVAELFVASLCTATVLVTSVDPRTLAAAVVARVAGCQITLASELPGLETLTTVGFHLAHHGWPAQPTDMILSTTALPAHTGPAKLAARIDEWGMITWQRRPTPVP